MNRTELRDLQTALELVFSGDMSIEAGCVADVLEDLGYDGLRLTRLVPPPFPLASTRGLTKRAST